MPTPHHPTMHTHPCAILTRYLAHQSDVEGARGAGEGGAGAGQCAGAAGGDCRARSAEHAHSGRRCGKVRDTVILDCSSHNANMHAAHSRRLLHGSTCGHRCEPAWAWRRIAAEAEEEAARLIQAADAAVQGARQAAMAMRGALEPLTLQHLHSLAASRLQAWLTAHPDAADFQVSHHWCLRRHEMQPIGAANAA